MPKSIAGFLVLSIYPIIKHYTNIGSETEVLLQNFSIATGLVLVLIKSILIKYVIKESVRHKIDQKESLLPDDYNSIHGYMFITIIEYTAIIFGCLIVAPMLAAIFQFKR